MALTLSPAEALMRAHKIDVAMQRSLANAPQEDGRRDTKFGEVRCGGATTVAAAVMGGEAGVTALLRGLKAPSLGNAHRMAVLEAAAKEMDVQQHLTAGTIQRLQDVMYAAGNVDGQPGTTGREQDVQVALSGLPTRAIAETDPGFTRGRKRELSDLWRERLQTTLRPGEAVPLFLTNGGPNMGHIVLFGRDRGGQLYAVDSLQQPGVFYASNPQHAAAIDDLLNRGMRFHGTRVMRVA